ncbi:MAG: hypothetical protein QME94_07325, partial [Anaerolineae bacterium]|nr:hypothetical protein [Anaerolineae bacterium]
MAEEQLPLFDRSAQPASGEDRQAPKVTARSPLHAAVAAFADHMQRVDFAENTVKSFLGDLSLLERYLGDGIEIGSIATGDLRRFMQYLRHGRGVPCTPKSYSRRLTTRRRPSAWSG